MRLSSGVLQVAWPEAKTAAAAEASSAAPAGEAPSDGEGGGARAEGTRATSLQRPALAAVSLRRPRIRPPAGATTLADAGGAAGVEPTGAELARFVSLTIAAVCGGGDGGADDAAAQRALVSTAALRFGPCFLLSSRHATLHQEAAAALGACAALGAAAVAWEPSALAVQRDGEEVPLTDALRAIVQGGTPTLTPAECAGLL